MNRFLASLVLATTFAWSHSATAQTVTTDPVGFYEVTINAGSDGRIGLSLHRAPALTTTVTGVAGNVITLAAALQAGQFVYNDGVQDDHFYLLVKDGDGDAQTDGPVDGKWYEVVTNDSTSVTVDQGGANETVETQGLVAGANVCLIPFWTLNTLFPSGEGLDASPDVFSPQGLVFLNDVETTGTNVPPAQAFIYHTGEQAAAGWYDINNLDPDNRQDDLPLAPDTFVQVRNPGGGKTITISGSVPMGDVSAEVVVANVTQDNQVVNPFPVPISLSETNLAQSGAVSASPDVFSPVDLVLLYEGSATGFNVPPSKVFLYHSGEQAAAGWYDVNNLDPDDRQDDIKQIQPGDAIIVRKAPGTLQVINWTATAPYQAPQ